MQHVSTQMATADFSPAEIRSLREDLGLTQEQLAERVGVARTTVTLWETGDRNPSGSAILLLDQLANKAAKKAARKKKNPH